MRSSLRALPFLWGALVSAALFVAVYLVFVRSYIGQVIDERAFAGADVWKGGVIEFAHTFLNALPVASVVIGAIVAVVIVLVRRNWLVFAVAVGAAVGANVSTQVLKYTILSRPEKGVDAGLANSLPSGHTAVAASAALVVFLLASPRFRPLAAVVGSIFAIAAGASTLVEQWHRPSDVVAGMLVVAFWGCIAGIVLAWLRLPGAEPPVRSKLWPLIWVGVVCLVGSVVALLVTYFSTQSGTEHLFIAYAGGVAAIVATGFVLAALGNRLYRRLA
ncbi:phosphatase PAP2 family protein [Leifsonia shinshuensis]|uniref:phosphatase PAP2 family protein n=1 Tax=Leifsonia TaxID=110932 RepID=UPI002856A5FA|nr:phosphatase PAP2 family protein [Leifsonia shinshuensis]MDR6972099.1 membrane-associated phospholipid phosphatase [Leifsonia shinshuensis]